jgi:hypothetical protein
MAVDIVEVVEAGGFQRQGLSCFEIGARIFFIKDKDEISGTSRKRRRTALWKETLTINDAFQIAVGNEGMDG